MSAACTVCEALLCQRAKQHTHANRPPVRAVPLLLHVSQHRVRRGARPCTCRVHRSQWSGKRRAEPVRDRIAGVAAPSARGPRCDTPTASCICELQRLVRRRKRLGVSNDVSRRPPLSAAGFADWESSGASMSASRHIPRHRAAPARPIAGLHCAALTGLRSKSNSSSRERSTWGCCGGC